jgi:hypothetical protein
MHTCGIDTGFDPPETVFNLQVLTPHVINGQFGLDLFLNVLVNWERVLIPVFAP